ncbi:MAG: PIN domain-containing protein [Parcubacteria group bacterium]|nr:PIN domain-containing protein [Parcubacteria group bacterium]
MKTCLLDTNVLIRFLVGDNRAQQKEAAAWFRQAQQGARRIMVTPLVVAEASFVLESFYQKKRGEVAEKLELFVSQRWLRVPERRALMGMWPWYSRGMHFVDGFLLSLARLHGMPLLTFDKKLKNKTS